MNASPGSSPALHQRRDHERRTGNTTPAVTNLIRDTHKVLEASGIVRSPSWVERTAAAYIRLDAGHGGIPFGVFLAVQLQMNAERRRTIARSHPELAYLMVYSDPTGEAAVRRILKKRGW